MNPPHPRPLSDDLPAQALAVLRQATRRETLHAGRRMAWHAWGRGRPVVLLHGGSGSWTHWLHNIEPLVAAGRAVHAPDLPGCGDSDLPAEGNDADALAPAVAAGLRQLFGGAPVDLVGFSFGGLVAGLMVAESPQLARRLVLVGAPVMGLHGNPVRLHEWRHLAGEERLAVHRANLAALMLHRPESLTPLALQLHAANLERDRLRKRRLAQTDALQQALSRVRLPLAAIYGREDALYQGRLAQLEDALRALPGMGPVRFIPEAGHWVQFEAPGAFGEALAAALEGS